MAFSESIADLRRIDREDLNRLGTSPVLLRAMIIFVVCAAVCGLGYHYLIKPKQQKLALVTQQESELRNKFDGEQAKAANREAYVEQLEEMKKTFNVMLRQLPNKTDIESLLVDLSQTSVASGLDVEYFKPEVEVPREFYAEYPIKISVSGQYHQFGQFVSGIAALPRIVTLSNIDITGMKNRDSSDTKQLSARKLKMDLVATTYRYLEED